MVRKENEMFVICFYWQGDRWQQKGYIPEPGRANPLQHHIARTGRIADHLPAKYVNNLYRGVSKFATKPFKFICFTNETLNLNKGIEVREFPIIAKSGVLPRLWMFSEEAGLFGHQVLCLDLDVVIVGSLEKLMNYDGKFCTRTKFKPGERYKLDGDVMSFTACKANETRFWKPFVDNLEWAENMTQGRERYWIRWITGGQADTWSQIAPGSVLSYKWHVRGRGIPLTASIISFHGKPRPHEIVRTRIKELWNDE